MNILDVISRLPRRLAASASWIRSEEEGAVSLETTAASATRRALSPEPAALEDPRSSRPRTPAMGRCSLWTILATALASFLMTGEVVADTTWVSGAVSGEWTRDGNPYIVVDSTWVEEGDSLIILEGVEVLFTEGQSLNVEGEMAVLGSAEDSVSFRSSDPRQRWDGVLLIGENTIIRFEYFKLKNLGKGIRLRHDIHLFIDHSNIECSEGAIGNSRFGLMRNCDITIANSILSCSSTVVSPFASEVAIEDSRIVSTSAAAISGDGHYSLERCYVYGSVRNNGYGYISYNECELLSNWNERYGYGDPFELSGNGSFMQDCQIQGSVIFQPGEYQSMDDCILEGSYVRVESRSNSVIRDCTFFFCFPDQADRLKGFTMAHDSRTQVQRCQILGSFSASDRSSALFDSCKIIGKYWSSARETMSLNRCVVVLGEFNIAHGSTANLTQNTFVNYSNQDRAVVFLNIGDPNRCSIINNIFISMQNSNQMIWIAQGADSSEFDIHQNCIYGFESIWAELSYVRFDIATNNILADPRLVSLEPLDAHLRENSPCIDAGDPQIFWDEDNTPPDIGAYWFDQLDVFQHATQITRESSNILFPNPTNGIIHINYTLNSSEIVTFSIYNTEGRRINTNWIIQANSGRNHSILNIPLLPTGMYFVVMKNNGSDSVFPIQLIR